MAQAASYPEFLVSTEWLARHLDDPGLRVLDPSTLLIPTPDYSRYVSVPAREDFEKAHVPGAAFVDMQAELSAPHAYLRFMLPDAQAFASAMAGYGVSDDSFVVTYATANHWWATRLWWMLRVFGHARVAVLDGGLQKWLAEGRPVETGTAAPRARGRYTPRAPELARVATREDVLAAIGAGDVCNINALHPKQHAGTGGVTYGRRGHIAGSVNVPAAANVNADHTFKSLEELGILYAQAMQKPKVITYCGGGIAATSVALALEMLGHRSVKVYDASLTEWAADAALPMEI